MLRGVAPRAALTGFATPLAWQRVTVISTENLEGRFEIHLGKEEKLPLCHKSRFKANRGTKIIDLVGKYVYTP